MTSLRTWYIATYRDANFVSPPAWFMLYSWLELFYHAPLSIWAIGALLRDDPRVPGHLVAYAMQTAVTTATCIADFLSWEDLSGKEKVELGKLLVFCFSFSFLFVFLFFSFLACFSGLLTIFCIGNPVGMCHIWLSVSSWAWICLEG